jgi:ATP-dependent Clp protease, protease subunit
VKVALLTLLMASAALASESAKYNPKGNTPIVRINRMELPAERTVVFKSQFNNFSANKFITDVKEAATKGGEVYIVITSGGGSMGSGLDMISTIGLLNVPTICIIEKYAYSMAAIFSSFCTHTFMHRFSEMMFHQASLAMDGEGPKFKSRTDHILEMIDMVMRLTAKQLKVPYPVFYRRIGDEWWFSAEKASRFGIIDGIVDNLVYKALDQPPEDFAEDILKALFPWSK